MGSPTAPAARRSATATPLAFASWRSVWVIHSVGSKRWRGGDETITAIDRRREHGSNTRGTYPGNRRTDCLARPRVAILPEISAKRGSESTVREQTITHPSLHQAQPARHSSPAPQPIHGLQSSPVANREPPPPLATAPTVPGDRLGRACSGALPTSAQADT